MKKFKDLSYGDLSGKTSKVPILVGALHLTSLEGAPKIVNGDFDCSFNKLTSLEYCPEIVKGNFQCQGNELTSLDYLPKKVYGNFDCSRNPLTQHEIDKLVQIEIKGRILAPMGLNAPSSKDHDLYIKLGSKKYFKLQQLKDKL